MEMENYKIVLRVGSRDEYLKVLDFEFRRWQRRNAFTKLASCTAHLWWDGSWCVTFAGAADDEGFLDFIELIIDERNKENLSIWSMTLYEDPWGFDAEIVV